MESLPSGPYVRTYSHEIDGLVHVYSNSIVLAMELL